MSKSIRVGSGRRSGQRFDAQHGVVTEALVFLGELDPEAIGEAMHDATHYEPTPLSQFEAALAAIPQPLEDFTFVDVGAGMGRVVLLATCKPFKQVVGVEVSPALAATARDNLAQWRRSKQDLACKDVRIVCADAAGFHFPPGGLVVYLYNPFGALTLARVTERLEAHAGGVYVVYHTPVHRQVFEEGSRFRAVADLGYAAIYALPSMPRSFCE